ncbi:MAG: M50 family metallopeptidase [Bacteroidota bacterium]
MKKSVSFLKVAGIGIYVHWTFSLLIIYIIYINARAGLDPVQISWAVFFVLALFLCVILHELGHALTAKRFGIKTQDITMYPIGGVARLERIPEKPMQELLVTIAGPLVNVLIVAILIPFIYGFDLFVPLGAESSIIYPENFILNLAILNLWLALFNLIPVAIAAKDVKDILHNLDELRSSASDELFGFYQSITRFQSEFYGNVEEAFQLHGSDRQESMIRLKTIAADVHRLAAQDVYRLYSNKDHQEMAVPSLLNLVRAINNSNESLLRAIEPELEIPAEKRNGN